MSQVSLICTYWFVSVNKCIGVPFMTHRRWQAQFFTMHHMCVRTVGNMDRGPRWWCSCHCTGLGRAVFARGPSRLLRWNVFAVIAVREGRAAAGVVMYGQLFVCFRRCWLYKHAPLGGTAYIATTSSKSYSAHFTCRLRRWRWAGSRLRSSFVLFRMLLCAVKHRPVDSSLVCIVTLYHSVTCMTFLELYVCYYDYIVLYLIEPLRLPYSNKAYCIVLWTAVKFGQRAGVDDARHSWDVGRSHTFHCLSDPTSFDTCRGAVAKFLPTSVNAIALQEMAPRAGRQDVKVDQKLNARILFDDDRQGARLLFRSQLLTPLLHSTAHPDIIFFRRQLFDPNAIRRISQHRVACICALNVAAIYTSVRQASVC